MEKNTSQSYMTFSFLTLFLQEEFFYSFIYYYLN